MINPLFYAKPDFTDVVIFVLIILIGMVMWILGDRLDRIEKQIQSLRDDKKH